MTLSVTDIGVEQVALPPAPSTTSASSAASTPPPLENGGRGRRAVPYVDMVLSNRVDPSSLSFRWPSVNISSGSYKIQASIPEESFLQESRVFHVLTGRNTACLAANPPLTGTTSSPSTSATGPSSPPAQTSGSWVPGGVGGSSRNPINTGAIIGIVLGVLAMTIVGVGAYFFVRRRRGKEQAGYGGAKKWNHLNSTDSRAGLMAAALAGNQKPTSRRLSSSQRRANYSNGSSAGHMTNPSQDDSMEKEMGSPDRSSRKDSVAKRIAESQAPETFPA
ncbi:hypothetical protein NMY22_g17196 [Coprinellus aureogranulatus]|nr:hypothetical protein NMY22_g17196 [Coprinellus aureogranulatus]